MRRSIPSGRSRMRGSARSWRDAGQRRVRPMNGLAPEDRPREKLAERGKGALGDNELLAVLLGHGSRGRHGAGSRQSVARRTRRSARPGARLAGRSRPAARRRAGDGRAHRGRRRAGSPKRGACLARRGCRSRRRSMPRGICCRGTERPTSSTAGVLLLDARHRVLHARVLTRGTADATPMHPRDVFREAALAGAAALVLFHNHPSGDPLPSTEDLAVDPADDRGRRPDGHHGGGPRDTGRHELLQPSRPRQADSLTRHHAALLSHDRHRLRQQPSAPRHGLREDHGRRHRPLQAPERRRHPLRDGQRRALAERVPAGARPRPGSAGLLRRHGAGVPRGLAARSTSRSTTSSAPRSRATRPPSRRIVNRIAAAGDLYQADYEGWYCVGCEAFKQEKDLIDGLCPIHRTKPDWIKERNHFFKLSAYRDRLLAHFAEHPEFLQPEVAAQRDPAPARSRARGHLDQPRRAVVGHPAADRSVERRVRLVRRADQLRVGRRPRHRPGACSTPGGRPTCTWSARTSRASTASSGRPC